MLEYWKLPEELEKIREPVGNELYQLISDKIKYIQYCYSNELTESQFKRVKQDEALVDKVSEYTELVSLQFNTILDKYVALCEAYTNLQHEKNKLLLESLTALKNGINEAAKT